MKSILIKIHSLIDIITNSSSEMFVQMSPKSIEGLKQLVNSVLTLANSDKKCDDLFDIKLVLKDTYEDEDLDFDQTTYQDDDEGQYRVRIKVKPLVENEEAEKAAKVLASIHTWFTAEERCC